uniref:Uncharacterized protein n=1 Tax=Arundo donax TaxID=35708 RepID=A0A0A9BCN5_ARUDO
MCSRSLPPGNGKEKIKDSSCCSGQRNQDRAAIKFGQQF